MTIVKRWPQCPGGTVVVAASNYDALAEIVRNIIACCDANDGDSLANAVNEARTLVEE